MTQYNTERVFRLLTSAYESADLWRTCRDNEVLSPICQQVNRNASINDIADKVIDHCRCHMVFKELLRIVNAQRPRRYEQFKGYLMTSSDEAMLVPTAREQGGLRDLILELAEWKSIHNNSQRLVDVLGVPVDLLTSCRYRLEVALLDQAVDRWQESCVPKLVGVPDKWRLQYAYSPILDTLRKETSDIEDITRHLCRIDSIDTEFKMVYLRLRELRGTLWEVLTIADKQIAVLVETMQNIIKE